MLYAMGPQHWSQRGRCVILSTDPVRRPARRWLWIHSWRMSKPDDSYGDRVHRLRDVPAFLQDATRRTPLDPGTNLLVATDLEQNVLGVKKLRSRRVAYERRSRLAYNILAPALEQMLPPRELGKGPTGIGYLVRGREGRAVPALDDLEWA